MTLLSLPSLESDGSGSGRVISVGVDLVSVTDVRDSVALFGDRYLRRVFTAGELVECQAWADPVPHLAARFAAKEAVIKALRVEDAQPPWTSMEVRRHPQAGPEIRLTGAAARLAVDRGVGTLSLSLSHEGEMAGAVVVATAAI